MLIIKSNCGKFRIPDDVEYGIYVANRRTVHYPLSDSDRTEVCEYGDLIFETPHMKCIFRRMREPGELYAQRLETIDDRGDTVIDLDEFDPAWNFEELEIQMRVK